MFWNETVYFVDRRPRLVREPGTVRNKPCLSAVSPEPARVWSRVDPTVASITPLYLKVVDVLLETEDEPCAASALVGSNVSAGGSVDPVDTMLKGALKNFCRIFDVRFQELVETTIAIGVSLEAEVNLVLALQTLHTTCPVRRRGWMTILMCSK